MEPPAKVRFSYQFERPLKAGSADTLPEFELPGEACPRSKPGNDVDLEDPMTASIWRRWITGIANIEK
jgi:hypothetical protein